MENALAKRKMLYHEINEVMHLEIDIIHTPQSRINTVDLDNPGFGTTFSDHMAVMHYTNNQWNPPKIIPFQELQVSPSLISLHYGQTVFEGMKAFRNHQGQVTLFRPEKHIERLNTSCRRLCIPDIDPDLFLILIQKLISIDRKWVPSKRGNALYIRPLIFASDEFLGVRPSHTYTCIIMTSPVGAYYTKGLQPVRLMTNPRYIRSARGGAGHVKTAGNYSVTLLPAKEALERGFDQVLWLDAKEQRFVEEVGTMNIFFKFKDCLVTPAIDGTILPGITRDSVIQLSKQWGYTVEERAITIDEVCEAYKKGYLEEVFGSGTAVVISPVGEIAHGDQRIHLGNDRAGSFTQKLYDEITGIQYGERDDIFQWNFHVC